MASIRTIVAQKRLISPILTNNDQKTRFYTSFQTQLCKSKPRLQTRFMQTSQYETSFDKFDKMKRLKCIEEFKQYQNDHPEKRTPLNEKNKGKLHFVFVEGVAATGKSSICKSLGNNGFTVRFEQFVELCNQNPMYKPEGSVVPTKWICSIFTAIEKYAKDYEQNSDQYQDNLVFFDRSLLTPYIYTRGHLNNLFACDVMKEIKQVFNCSLILCQAPHTIITNRLQQRYDAGTEQEKQVRIKLGELDDQYLRMIQRRYEELLDEGWFDATLETGISVKDSTTQLLRMLGSNHSLFKE